MPSTHPYPLTHRIHAAGGHGDTAELVTYLQPLLEQYGVDAYLCGHDHISEWLTHKGITYIVAGEG